MEILFVIARFSDSAMLYARPSVIADSERTVIGERYEDQVMANSSNFEAKTI